MGVMIVIRNQGDSGASLITRSPKAHAAMMPYQTTRNPMSANHKATINFALKKIKLKMESLDHLHVHHKIQVCVQKMKMCLLQSIRGFSIFNKENLHGIDRCPHQKPRIGIASMSLELKEIWFKILIKVRMGTSSYKLSNMVLMNKFTSLFKSIKSTTTSRFLIIMTK